MNLTQDKKGFIFGNQVSWRSLIEKPIKCNILQAYHYYFKNMNLHPAHRFYKRSKEWRKHNPKPFRFKNQKKGYTN